MKSVAAHSADKTWEREFDQRAVQHLHYGRKWTLGRLPEFAWDWNLWRPRRASEQVIDQ